MELLSKAISDLLLDDGSIMQLVGAGNVWHGKIPQLDGDQSVTPADTSVYYYTYAVVPNDTKSGEALVDDHMVRFHVLGKDDYALGMITRFIRMRLDRLEPGVYSGIQIDGCRFTNAFFEPDEAYQLEDVQWVIEFKFRVINNELRE